jgi:hypothetical protein
LCRLGEGEEKNVASGRGLAVQLREKRKKKFKGRAGCAVEGGGGLGFPRKGEAGRF